MNRLRIIGIHQLPQQRAQVRNTRMMRVTGTIHLHDSHTLQRAARQVTRNLSHGRTPRHTQARAVINQGIKQRRGSTGHLTHTGDGGRIRAHVHEGDAHLIAFTNAALQFATGTEGFIQADLHHTTLAGALEQTRHRSARHPKSSRNSVHRHVVDVVQLRRLVSVVSAFVHRPQTPSENPFKLLGYYFTIGFYYLQDETPRRARGTTRKSTT
ncbi:Uncharacterised protein [Mycobacterium tuberculosis]|nr:Uncharacterised protein [Mycobacterium tuberculosis]